MFECGGTSYVYLIYGVHNCFNVVTGRRGQAEAVLIRALEPLDALATDTSIASGPGKLSRALHITRQHSGVDLVADGELCVARGRRISADRIQSGPRIGVGYAGDWAGEPMRFWLHDHPAVSKAR
jgi:DNA-3-methyladenine glycosylase